MFKRVCAGVIAFAIMLSFCMTANAMDANYLEDSKWYHNENISTKKLDLKSNKNYLDGTLSYFFDNDDNCFYIKASVWESSVVKENNNVFFSFEIENDKENIAFSVNENGIDNEIYQERYSTIQRFESDYNLQTGNYVVALKINNDELINYLSARLFINGHGYLLIEQMLLDATVKTEEQTTQNTAKTSEKSTKTKESTTKFHATTTVTKSKTTKFYAEYVASETTEITEESSITEIKENSKSKQENMKETFSQPTIIALAVSCTIILCVLIFTLPLLNKRSKSNDNKDNTKIDDKRE